MSANTVILYNSNTLSNPIEVFIEDETVWLTQLQMAEIEANLDFLQKQARAFEVEGFQVEGF